MDRATQLFVFGDQTSAFDAKLKTLLAIKDDAVLTAFFNKVAFSLRQEIGQLPQLERTLFPRFTSLSDLLIRYRELEVPHPALVSALVTIHQLASFISTYSKATAQYPLPSETTYIGLCTGLLAAAAVSSSRNLAELIPAAIQAILVSFRTGLRAAKVGSVLHKGSSFRQTWSLLVAAKEQEAQALITDFCLGQNVPFSAVLYLSAIMTNSVTISGPPALLEQFTATIPHLKPLSYNISAPYHAGHLYSTSDIKDVLNGSNGIVLESYIPRAPLLSNLTGKPFSAPTYGELLQSAVTEILTQPLRWNTVAESYVTSLTAQCLPCTISPIATNAAQGLMSAVHQAGLVCTIDTRFTDVLIQTDGQAYNGRKDQSSIAIIGYSGRFPEADDPEELWALLCKGLDVHKEVPKSRWDAHKYFDPTGKRKNTSGVLNGCWIKEPGHFDARFFNMSPREAAQSDPAQRLALMTAYEALEMAGFVPDSSPSTQRDRVGVFYGTTSDDWREVNSGQNVDTYFIPGGNRAFVPGRINYHFKFSGPSYSVDTACSSSFAAIHIACNSLWRGDCDSAIAGGTNILTNPDNHAGLDRGHFLSRTGNCNTFDDEASGYCRADAVATVVLKRLEDALADNDTILGTILGTCTNHSAEAVSITRPLADAQVAVFERILTAANVDSSDVSYIEMHGTGTQAGDAVEMKSVLATFAPDATKKRDLSLHLGSVKSNIGHAESASGVASLVKVLLMMKHNAIPPHCGIKTRINQGFPTDLQQRNVHIAMKQTSWTGNGSKRGLRKAFLNNFSAAGGNTAILLQDAEPRNEAHDDNRPLHAIAVTGKSLAALKNNAEALATYVESNPQTSLGSLSYTTTARRTHHSFRSLVWGDNARDIAQAIRESSSATTAPSPAVAPRVAFTFTGQGSQYFGMAADLLAFSCFRDALERFDGIAQTQGFPSFLFMIRETETVRDMQEVSPIVLQLAISCVELACVKLWHSLGIIPSTVIGHSLGEFAALNVAGVLSDSDTIFVIAKRAALLEEHCTRGTHAMLAVQASESKVNEYLGDSQCEISCLNSPNETVVGGSIEDIAVLSEKLTSDAIQCTKLKVQFAFHTAQVDSMLNAFEDAVRNVTFHTPKIPILSASLGKVIPDGKAFENGPEYLRRQCRDSVQYSTALQNGLESKIIDEKTVWIEIGPHPITSGFIKATLGPNANPVATLNRKERSWKTLSKALSFLYLKGVEISWSEYHHDFRQHLQVLPLPAYKWDLKNHWIDYVHDWCLTKGNAPTLPVPVLKATDSEPKATLLTTTVQHIVEERINGTTASVIAESDIQHPQLASLIDGHKVNGVSLCPSSAYADMALTIGDYLLTRCTVPGIDKQAGMEVCEVAVEKPLIANIPGVRFFRVSGVADWTLNQTAIEIFSVNEGGVKTVTHCKCLVKYGNTNSWMTEWRRNAYLINARVEGLIAGERKDLEGYQKIRHGLFYRLFSSLVKYDQKYRGHNEVILNAGELEAIGKVTFKSTDADGKFFRSPFWIDSLGQISGFVMNATDALEGSDMVFINHGWDSMRCAVPLLADKIYRTYVKMQLIGKNMYAGDVYIFEQDGIVGVYQGVKFQGIPRKLMASVLPNNPAAVVKGNPTSATRSIVPGTSSPSKTVNTKPVSDRRSTTELARSTTPTVLTIQPPGRTGSASAVPIRRIASSNGLSIVDRMIKVLAEEIGVLENDLLDDEELVNLGVDSLLGLTIADRLRTELDVDIESSIFIENPTVRALKASFGESANPKLVLSPASPVTTRKTAFFPTPSTSATQTPSSERESYFSDESSASSVSGDDGAADKFNAVVHILAEEIGMQMNEIDSGDDLSNLGLDSLMSLTVISRLRDEMDVELESDFFIRNTTLLAVRMGLGLNEDFPAKPEALKESPPPVNLLLPAPARSRLSRSSSTTNLRSRASSSAALTLLPIQKRVLPPATSVLLQGSAKRATKRPFLFPDGSGSASSYMRLPRVAPDIAIYGLNCPFMKDAAGMAGVGLADLTGPYVAEIRRRQPSGPYLLGGWSAGGICAYDAAQTLVREGQIVERLVLIDSPNPIGLTKLPPRLYDFFSGLGMFGGRDGGEGSGKPPPSWLLPHFMAFIEALDTYKPVAWAKGVPKPETWMVWASDGVCGGDKPKPTPQPDDTREMKWLLEDRSEFGMNGWNQLLGEGHAKVEVIKGVDHFSMMEGPNTGKLSAFLGKAVA